MGQSAALSRGPMLLTDPSFELVPGEVCGLVGARGKMGVGTAPRLLILFHPFAKRALLDPDGLAVEKALRIVASVDFDTVWRVYRWPLLIDRDSHRRWVVQVPAVKQKRVPPDFCFFREHHETTRSAELHSWIRLAKLLCDRVLVDHLITQQRDRTQNRVQIVVGEVELFLDDADMQAIEQVQDVPRRYLLLLGITTRRIRIHLRRCVGEKGGGPLLHRRKPESFKDRLGVRLKDRAT